MNFELLRIALALIGTGAAAWQDAHTSFIDDNLLYGMVIAGALLNLATLDFEFIHSVFLGFAFIMLLGYIAFRAGQFGAGDVYLLAGLHLLLPLPVLLAPEIAVPAYLLIFPPVVSIFIFASLAATAGSALLYAFKLSKNAPSVLTSLKARTLLVGMAAALAGLSLGFGLTALQSLILFSLGASSAFLFLFRDEIMRFVIVKKVPLSKVEDEDVLDLSKLPKATVKKFNIGKVATKENLARIRKAGLKQVFVHSNLPRFGPYLLLGLAATLLFGDFVAYLLLH